MERDEDFIFWKYKTPIGIKVEEVFGMESMTEKVWLEFARQIFCEQGADNFREIGHFANGAPFIWGSMSRISISHTSHFFVAAFLPKTPEANLGVFNPRTAMGIDVEKLDRKQVLDVRGKFLNDSEQELVGNDLQKNIMAWTAKEALYKAVLTPGLDFKTNILIESLPELDYSPEKTTNPSLGKAFIKFPGDDQQTSDSGTQEMNLYSYESNGCCVTIAFSPKCAKFGKS